MKKINGYITVHKGGQESQRGIHSCHDWFNVEYYIIKTDEFHYLTITKCYLEIPKNAHKFTSAHRLTVLADIPCGKYYFDEDESTEDKLVICYKKS